MTSEDVYSRWLATSTPLAPQPKQLCTQTSLKLVLANSLSVDICIIISIVLIMKEMRACVAFASSKHHFPAISVDSALPLTRGGWGYHKYIYSSYKIQRVNIALYFCQISRRLEWAHLLFIISNFRICMRPNLYKTHSVTVSLSDDALR